MRTNSSKSSVTAEQLKRSATKREYRQRAAKEHPLATQLAIVALSRVLRPVLRIPDRFVVTAVVPKGSNIYSFNAAAHWLIELRGRENPLRQETEVVVVNEDADLEKVITLTKLEGTRRAIILLSSEDFLTPEIRILSDIVANIPDFTARDIKIAAIRMGFGKISDVTAEFLASEDLRRLSLVMRRGRSVGAMIARLRIYPKPEETPKPEPVDFTPTLNDLYGFGAAKTWGLELATDLAEWKAGNLPWSDVDRGLLLSGPPGCGKTSYAAALARTCGVNLVQASAARWQSTGHLGDMLKAMRRDFADALKNAPSILFIDEFDSFPNREDLEGESASYNRQVVNGLLEVLDGATGREGVVVIGATNYPDVIDEALLRPGRLERHCAIPLPDVTSRVGIFRYHLREDLVSSSLDIVIGRSEGWTGADIERCVRDARRLARRERRPMELRDLIISMPPRTRVPPDFLRSVAVHELGHAIVGVLVDADQLVSVTIEDSFDSRASQSSLGHACFQERSVVRKTSTYFEDKIAVLMAGMAAERVVFGDHSNGAAGHRQADLNIATDLATMMEIKWAFGNTVSSEVYGKSKDLARMRLKRGGLAHVVETTLRKQLERAESILTDNRAALDALTDKLLLERRLTALDIAEAVKTPARELHARTG